MGPGRFSPWNENPGEEFDPTDEASMGPGRFRPWNPYSREVFQRTRLASMGPGRFSPWNLLKEGTRLAVGALLQWGQGGLVPGIAAEGGGAADAEPASMGPGRFSPWNGGKGNG